MKPTLARKIFCIAALLCCAAWNANANQVADPGFEASADGLARILFLRPGRISMPADSVA